MFDTRQWWLSFTFSFLVSFPPFNRRTRSVKLSPAFTFLDGNAAKREKKKRKGKCSSKRTRQRRATFLSSIGIRDAYVYIFLSYFPTNGSLINLLSTIHGEVLCSGREGRRLIEAHIGLSCNFQFMSILYIVLGRAFREHSCSTKQIARTEQTNGFVTILSVEAIFNLYLLVSVVGSRIVAL